MTAVLKNINEYNKTYHEATKMKSLDVKFGSYAKYSVDSNAKDTKFRIDDHA